MDIGNTDITAATEPYDTSEAAELEPGEEGNAAAVPIRWGADGTLIQFLRQACPIKHSF
jgi:hypothetical protein